MKELGRGRRGVRMRRGDVVAIKGGRRQRRRDMWKKTRI